MEYSPEKAGEDEIQSTDRGIHCRKESGLVGAKVGKSVVSVKQSTVILLLVPSVF